MSQDKENALNLNPSQQYWKTNLVSQIKPDWANHIDEFETEIFLKKQEKIEDKIFAETRLRYGAYGQRYDNGKRHDGKTNRPIEFPNNLTKGPGTVWEAPGMLRIKIPYGGMNATQLDVCADLAEEYADGILHITTRQDIQYHFIHIEDTPSMFRRLAAVGITTKEACGNSVRNVTGCPISGVCSTEIFDVTPYADALTFHFLGHPDIQDFGRKFKIAFSGCADKPCGLVRMHDMGFVAKVRDGKRGFEVFVGGGLGAVPQQAKLFTDFMPEEELMPLSQAVFRIFARHGEKAKRNRARIKFLVHDWGIEKFRNLVNEERAKLKDNPEWLTFLKHLHDKDESPLKPAGSKIADDGKNPKYTQWLKHNVEAQVQPGYSMIHIALPLGDITANQARGLAEISRKYVKETIRTTVNQGLVLRWVSNDDLPAVFAELDKLVLADPVSDTILDMVSCPGTDTCKLGVSASRGLAGKLREHLAAQAYAGNEDVNRLKIKMSGCFNSCSQQHLADIGFYGVSRKNGNYLVPHFQLILGGRSQENGSAYGLPIGSFPSKAIPTLVDRLVNMFSEQKEAGENFQDFIKRVGKVSIKTKLNDLAQIPSYEENKSYYTDWGDVREFTTSDIGIGECAGEIVSLVDFGLKTADREIFDAQITFDKGELDQAAEMAYLSMVRAAQALIKGYNPDISDNPDDIYPEFQKKFCDTKTFFDPFQGDKFATFFLKARTANRKGLDADHVREMIEEAGLFIEAAYSCHVRMSMTQ